MLRRRLLEKFRNISWLDLECPILGNVWSALRPKHPVSRGPPSPVRPKRPCKRAERLPGCWRISRQDMPGDRRLSRRRPEDEVSLRAPVAWGVVLTL